MVKLLELPKKNNIIPFWEITHDSNLVWFWDIIYNFKYTTLIILGILLNFRNKIHDFNHSWDLVKFLIHNINPWLVWDIFTILNPRHYSWLVFTSEIRWISTHDTNHVWARKSKNTTLVRFPFYSITKHTKIWSFYTKTKRSS